MNHQPKHQMVVVSDKEKKAHKVIDVTHVFIKFMADSLQKTIESQFGHCISKIFSSYKKLNKASICL